MDTLAQRLDAAMKAKSVKIPALVAVAGMTYQGIKKVLDGKTASLKYDNLIPIASFLGVNPDWLATGEGPMTPGQQPAPRPAPVAIDQPSALTAADHLRALVDVFASAPDSTRDTVAMLAAGAIKNPATLPDCVRAIEALAAFGAAKGGPPTESKQFHPPVSELAALSRA